MSVLFVLGVFGAPAWAVAGTDTGTTPADADTDADADADADTDADASGDTAASTCVDCLGAAADVGESGGSACEDGCSTSGPRALPAAAVLAALLSSRRRRR